MKKRLLILLFMPVLALANSLHLQPQYAVNELNKANTFQGSQRVLFTHQEQKFAMGFYPATIDNKPDEEHPFLVLTAWTQDGWVFLAKLPPIWGGNLGMFMGSERDDIHNYLWYVGQTFDGPMADYLYQAVSDGDGSGDGGGTPQVPLVMWQKILQRLQAVDVVDDQLQFN